MTKFRDKIGQMLILGFDGFEVNTNDKIIEDIYSCNLGGVILFDYNLQTKAFGKNILNPQQLYLLNTSLQSFNSLANLKYNREMVPLFIALDYEGGQVNRLKKQYGFMDTLSAIELANMSIEKAEQIFLDMAFLLYNTGFNLNFAPVVDLNFMHNPIIGALGRSFSKISTEVVRCAEIFIKSFAKFGIMCTYKHFPGLGSAISDPHKVFVDVSSTWEREELKPYEILLGSGNNKDAMIMTAHCVNNKLDKTGLPATFSKSILFNLLRSHLRFEGIIVSDDLQMPAITSKYSLRETLTLAINAGVNLLLFGNQLVSENCSAEFIVNIIENQVAKGYIHKDSIEESYRRIVDLKLRPKLK